MIPSHLSTKPRASLTSGQAQASIQAPAYFKPARPLAANIVSYSPSPSKPTPAQAAGLRYEKRWHQFAAEHLGPSYQTFENRQIAFSDEVYGWRTCRPDGIALVGNVLYIFEVKIRHTADAYWQLEKLYKPVLSHFYPSTDKVLIEVTKNLDPSTPFPVDYHLMHGAEFLLGDSFKLDTFNVLLWS